jgi:hypothetical protein
VLVGLVLAGLAPLIVLILINRFGLARFNGRRSLNAAVVELDAQWVGVASADSADGLSLRRSVATSAGSSSGARGAATAWPVAADFHPITVPPKRLAIGTVTLTTRASLIKLINPFDIPHVRVTAHRRRRVVVARTSEGEPRSDRRLPLTLAGTVLVTAPVLKARRKRPVTVPPPVPDAERDPRDRRHPYAEGRPDADHPRYGGLGDDSYLEDDYLEDNDDDHYRDTEEPPAAEPEADTGPVAVEVIVISDARRPLTADFLETVRESVRTAVARLVPPRAEIPADL